MQFELTTVCHQCMMTSSAALASSQDCLQPCMYSVQQHFIMAVHAKHTVHLTGTQTGLVHLFQKELKLLLDLLWTGMSFKQTCRLTAGTTICLKQISWYDLLPS